MYIFTKSSFEPVTLERIGKKCLFFLSKACFASAIRVCTSPVTRLWSVVKLHFRFIDYSCSNETNRKICPVRRRKPYFPAIRLQSDLSITRHSVHVHTSPAHPVLAIIIRVLLYLLLRRSLCPFPFRVFGKSAPRRGRPNVFPDRVRSPHVRSRGVYEFPPGRGTYRPFPVSNATPAHCARHFILWALRRCRDRRERFAFVVYARACVLRNERDAEREKRRERDNGEKRVRGEKEGENRM